ncbi:MAG: YlxR family protein [Firmicutes bacterium]|nr:YlxR family protein [Bacillota bacterium]
MQQRKQPMRMCNGCGEMKPKRQLIRVVKSPDGAVSLDTTGKRSGRGAYICPSAECLKKARRNRRIDRTFEMTIPDEIYDTMESEIANNGQ